MRIDVLDKGFVSLVNLLGDDATVVQSARVSFGNESKGEEKDRKLIRYLLANGHETPFEHVVFQFHVKCPIFVARQWFRHRWASYNEISGRYTVFDDGEFYVPARKRVREKVNRQGSVVAELSEEDHKSFAKSVEAECRRSVDAYRRLLEEGTARELARTVLPVGMYTQFYWTVNARSLMNFLKLRCDEHAQYEMREYAFRIREIFIGKMPWTAAAFDELISEKGD